MRYAATNASRFVESVYWGVSISKQVDMAERQNLELNEGGNDWKKKDGNCEGLSISSDLGVLTTCQKHLPVNLTYLCMCVCGHVSVYISMIHVFATNWVVKLLAVEVKGKR